MSAPFPFDLSDQCVRCGLCLPHCPTYKASGRESEGPRGRIAIMEAVAQARIELTPIGRAHIDNCLGCARCESVCPAKVSYLEIRDHHFASRITPGQRRLIRWLSRPASRLSVIALRTGAGLARLLMALLPRQHRQGSLTAAITLAAGTRSRTLSALPGKDTGTVEIFVGCVASSVDNAPATHLASLLDRLGIPARPSTAHCCGALAQHAGALDLAQAQRSVQAESARALVALDSGCIGDLRRSGRMVHEACRFVVENWPERRIATDHAETVAVHLPCTHQNVCGDADAVVALLSRIPQLQTIVVRGQGCCGASGLQMLTKPEHGRRFAEALLAEIPAGVSTLVSTNVGCRMHLRRVARASGRKITVVHPLELLRFDDHT